MNRDDHLARAEEFEHDLRILLGTGSVGPVCELAFISAHHYIAFGCARLFTRHNDIHRHTRLLKDTGAPPEVIDAWTRIDEARHGHVYGGQGNGDTAKSIMTALEVIRSWALG
jgi:hypothetical protein